MTNESEDGIYHDEVEIEDFDYDVDTETFSYPCPCGDTFIITKEDLENGESVARCPSCSLILKVVFNIEDIESICSEKQKQINPSKTLVTN